MEGLREDSRIGVGMRARTARGENECFVRTDGGNTTGGFVPGATGKEVAIFDFHAGTGEQYELSIASFDECES